MSIQILHFEPSLLDAQLAWLTLKNDELHPEIDHVETFEEFEEALEERRFDIVLCEYALHRRKTANDVLAYLKSKGIQTPVVVLSNVSDQKIIAEVLANGASDYLFKSHLRFLGSALREVLSRKPVARPAPSAAPSLDAEFLKNLEAIKAQLTKLQSPFVDSAPTSAARAGQAAASSPASSSDALEQMQKRIDDLTETITTLNANNFNLQNALEEARAEIQALKEQSAAASQLEEARQALLQLANELKNAQERERLTAAAYEEERQTANRLKAELAEKTEQGQALEREFEKLQRQLLELSEELRNAQERERLTAAAYEEERQTANRLKAELAEKTEQGQALEREFEKLQRQLLELSEELRNAQERERLTAAAYEEERQTANRLKAELAEKTEQGQALEREFEKLQRQLLELSEEMRNAQERERLTAAAYEEERQTANRLKAEISEKAEREKELMDEIDKAQEAEMQLRIELQDAIITGNELRDAIAKAESQLAQFETIFKQYEAALNAQLSNASALSEQAESAKAELATAQEEKRSLESKLAAAQESARALAERFAIQLDELRAKLAEETENRTRLEQELAEAKRAIEILESTPKGNPEREAKLEAELAEAQRALSHLRADWEQANREVERLENDVKIVEASFQEKSAKLLDLQKRLKAKEKELAEKSAMLDALNLAIVMVNPSGEICYWNESAAVFHGVPAGEALGKKSDDIMKYKYASAKERKSAMESLQSVGRWNGRIKYATPDGEQKTAEVFISRLDDEVGNPLGVLTILNDITKRSAMEADYHRFKQIIEPMLNAVPIALLAFDDAGVIMGVFGKTDELQKLNPTIANGKSIYELYGKYPPLLGAFRRVLSGESFSTTIAAGEASVEFHFSPIVKNGAIAGAVGALLEAEQTVERS